MGNWLRFSIDWWFSVVCCIYRFFWLFLTEAQATRYFPVRATIHLHCD